MQEILVSLAYYMRSSTMRTAVWTVTLTVMLVWGLSARERSVTIGNFRPAQQSRNEDDTEQKIRSQLAAELESNGLITGSSGELRVSGLYSRSKNGVLNLYVQIFSGGHLIDAYNHTDISQEVSEYGNINLPREEILVSDQTVIENTARRIAIQIRSNPNRKFRESNIDRYVRLTGLQKQYNFPMPKYDESKETKEVFRLLEEQEVITATRTVTNIRNAPAAVYVVTAKEIRERGYRTLVDALKDVPGFDIIHNYGIFPELIHQRGLVGNNQRTLLYVDGVLDNNLTEAAILGGSIRFPLHNVKRIEIVAGPASALYGANAFNGVINIITHDDESRAGHEANFTAGGYNNLDRPGYSTDISIRGSSVSEASDLQYSVSGYYYETKGPFFGNLGRLEDPNAGKNDVVYRTVSDLCGGTCNPDANSTGYYWSPLYNNSNEKTYNITGRFTLGDFRFQTVNWQYLQGEGTFANATQQLDTDKSGYAGSHWDFRNNSFTAGYLHSFSSKLSLDTEIGVRHTSILSSSSEQYPNTPGITHYYIPQPVTTSSDYARPDEAYDFKQKLEYEQSSNASTIIGIEGNHTVVPEAYGSEKRIRTGNYASYVQQMLRPLEWLQFTAGYRYDYSTNYGEAHTPRLGTVFHAGSDLTFKFLLGSGFRAPTAWELFNDTNRRLRNEDLEPEKLRSAEFGVAYRFKRDYYFSAQAYVNEIENLILEVQTGQPNPTGGNWNQNQNVGNARIRGFEWQTEFLITNAVRLNVNHTYSKGRYTDLPYSLAASPTIRGRPGDDPLTDAGIAVIDEVRQRETEILQQLEAGILSEVSRVNPALVADETFLRELRNELPSQLFDLAAIPSEGEIPNIARHKVNLGFTWYPVESFSADLRVNYVSHRRTISTNSERTIPAYYFYTVNFRWQDPFGIEDMHMSLLIRNVTNDQLWDPGIRTATGVYYPTRHPVENRNFWLTLGYRF